MSPWLFGSFFSLFRVVYDVCGDSRVAFICYCCRHRRSCYRDRRDVPAGRTSIFVTSLPAVPFVCKILVFNFASSSGEHGAHAAQSSAVQSSPTAACSCTDRRNVACSLQRAKLDLKGSGGSELRHLQRHTLSLLLMQLLTNSQLMIPARLLLLGRGANPLHWWQCDSSTMEMSFNRIVGASMCHPPGNP